jgi:hypothetical protein
LNSCLPTFYLPRAMQFQNALSIKVVPVNRSHFFIVFCQNFRTRNLRAKVNICLLILPFFVCRFARITSSRAMSGNVGLIMVVVPPNRLQIFLFVAFENNRFPPSHMTQGKSNLFKWKIFMSSFDRPRKFIPQLFSYSQGRLHRGKPRVSTHTMFCPLITSISGSHFV